MKFIINGKTICGFGSTEFLLTGIKGFDALINLQMIKVPRTDYSEFTSNFSNTPSRTVDFDIFVSSATDFLQKKRELVNMTGNFYEITIIDDYFENGVITELVRYTFSGYVSQVQTQSSFTGYTTKVQLAIMSEDPYIYSTTEITGSADLIGYPGLVFPLIFPIVFGANFVDIVVNNTGLVPAIPTYTVTGATGGGFNITNLTTNLVTPYFIYTEDLLDGEQVIITPLPNDAEKVRKNGVSVIADTNANFEPLFLAVGNNTLRFTVSGGVSVDTLLELSFYPAYKGIGN